MIFSFISLNPFLRTGFDVLLHKGPQPGPPLHDVDAGLATRDDDLARVEDEEHDRAVVGAIDEPRCTQCPADHYCAGGTAKEQCPESSTAPAGSAVEEACVCVSGFRKEGEV